MSGLIAGDVPTAWQYASARLACAFRREWIPDGPDTLCCETCGLCGQSWIVGGSGPRIRYWECNAVEVWRTVHDHCADHAVGSLS